MVLFWCTFRIWGTKKCHIFLKSLRDWASYTRAHAITHVRIKYKDTHPTYMYMGNKRWVIRWVNLLTFGWDSLADKMVHFGCHLFRATFSQLITTHFIINFSIFSTTHFINCCFRSWVLTFVHATTHMCFTHPACPADSLKKCYLSTLPPLSTTTLTSIIALVGGITISTKINSHDNYGANVGLYYLTNLHWFSQQSDNWGS